MPVELGVQDLQPRLPSGWKAVSNEPTRNVKKKKKKKLNRSKVQQISHF